MSSCWALTSLPGYLAEVHSFSGASQVMLVVKNPHANLGDTGDSSSVPGWGRSPGEDNGNLSSILAWEIPWTEESDGLQSMGLQRVKRD